MNKRGHNVPGSTKDQIRKIKNKKKNILKISKIWAKKGPKNANKIEKMPANVRKLLNMVKK